jgi:hypothetical protein
MGSKWEANGKQQEAIRRKPCRALSSQTVDSVEFRQADENPGNCLAYVDIVGVTGSIPVAPTIHKSGPRIACQQSPGQAAGTLLPDTARSGEVDAPRAILAELKRP